MRNFILITALTLAGCASYNGGSSYSPIVDIEGVDMGTGKYAKDLRECQAYASRAPGAGATAFGGAIAGAILGYALGAVGGGNKNQYAGVGAVSGAATGLGQGEVEQRNIIRKCLAGRGYKVLD